jgi:hypothetical protein
MMGAAAGKVAAEEPTFEGKTSHQWNMEGVNLHTKSTAPTTVAERTLHTLRCMDCYLGAVAASPGHWLGYQNAGHSCIQLEWWEGSIYFHERVRELDTKYDNRAEKDKCECLTHARSKLQTAKKQSYARLWHFEDVTPPGLDLAQLTGEAAIDPCWVERRTPEGKFLLRVNGQPFVFDSLAKRQHVLSGLQAICREREARAAEERLTANAQPGHAVLRSDVLQHVLSFLTDDWRGKSICVFLVCFAKLVSALAEAGLVCKGWLRVSCRNALWRAVWLRHVFPSDAPLTPQEHADLRNVAAFGSDGFLKRLLLRHPPLVRTNVPAQGSGDEMNDD